MPGRGHLRFQSFSLAWKSCAYVVSGRAAGEFLDVLAESKGPSICGAIRGVRVAARPLASYLGGVLGGHRKRTASVPRDARVGAEGRLPSFLHCGIRHLGERWRKKIRKQKHGLASGFLSFSGEV